MTGNVTKLKKVRDKSENGEIFVYFADISPLFEQSVYQNCYAASPQMRRGKADGLAAPADKARCIGAGLLLAYACADFLAGRKDSFQEKKGERKQLQVRVVPVTELLDQTGNQNRNENENTREAFFAGSPVWRIAEEKGKKPYFCREDGSRDEAMPCFNISHSGKYVGCALSWVEIGFDIQQQKKPQDAVLKRVFSKEERSSVKASENPALTFAGLWSAKEAAVKLDGVGIAGLLSQRDEVPSVPSCPKEDRSRENTHVFSGFMEEEYAWSVAVYSDALQHTGI